MDFDIQSELEKICKDLNIFLLTEKQFKSKDSLILAAFGASIFQPVAVICDKLDNYGVFTAQVRQQHPIIFFTKECPISGLLNYSIFNPKLEELKGLLEVILPVNTNKLIFVKD